MESRLLRIGWIVLLVLGIFWIASSFYTLSGGWQERAWEQMTGQAWSSFAASNPAATAQHISMSARMDGVAQLAMGALVVMIVLFAYRRGQKWSWYALLAGGIIYWLGFLIFEIIAGGPIPWVVLGLILLIVGLALPAKDILTQKSG